MVSAVQEDIGQSVAARTKSIGPIYLLRLDYCNYHMNLLFLRGGVVRICRAV